MAKQELDTALAPRLWPSSTQSGEGGEWSRGEQKEMESDRELRKSVEELLFLGLRQYTCKITLSDTGILCSRELAYKT